MGLQGRVVLIVDDDPDMRKLSRKILESTGICVLEASSVREGFQVVSQTAPHLVLLDLQMPQEPGFRFLELKSAYPSLKDVPVIVASSRTDKESIHKAIGGGACDYLLKPFIAPHLVQKIRKALKDTDFKAFQFPPGKRPHVNYAVAAEISKIEETSFLLESSVKLAPNTKIQIRCETFSKAGMDSCVFKSASNEPVRTVSKQYMSRVNVAGLSETLQRKLKKAESAS